MFQATLGQHKGLGVAAKKKDARKEAAKDLLEKLEKDKDPKIQKSEFLDLEAAMRLLGLI